MIPRLLPTTQTLTSDQFQTKSFCNNKTRDFSYYFVPNMSEEQENLCVFHVSSAFFFHKSSRAKWVLTWQQGTTFNVSWYKEMTNTMYKLKCRCRAIDSQVCPAITRLLVLLTNKTLLSGICEWTWRSIAMWPEGK